jgi:hypothetical protein
MKLTKRETEYMKYLFQSSCLYVWVQSDHDINIIESLCKKGYVRPIYSNGNITLLYPTTIGIREICGTTNL